MVRNLWRCGHGKEDAYHYMQFRLSFHILAQSPSNDTVFYTMQIQYMKFCSFLSRPNTRRTNTVQNRFIDYTIAIRFIGEYTGQFNECQGALCLSIYTIHKETKHLHDVKIGDTGPTFPASCHGWSEYGMSMMMWPTIWTAVWFREQSTGQKQCT